MSTLRSHLLLKVLAALLPGVLGVAAWSAFAWPVLIGAIALAALAGIGALWAARRIATALQALDADVRRLTAGEPFEPQVTGIAEIDHVASALAAAAVATHGARAAFERRLADAVSRTRDAEQRIAPAQRIQVLGRLSGDISHDFNNVLGVISNSAHLLQRSADDAALGPPLAAILRAVDLGSRLSHQLQRFAGRRPAAPRPLQLDRFFAEVRDLVTTVLGRRIRLEIEVAPGTPAVTVEASEFELALLTLALNARDALPRGGCVWLHARLASDEEAQGLAPLCVLVSVGDDGVGIDEAAAARMAAQLSDASITATAEGRMDGLRQVHDFCIRAGGSARVTGTPGLGTTIALLLPGAPP